MLATDFNLEIVEKDCFKNLVLLDVLQGPAPSLWSQKEADSMLCALLVTWLLLDLDCWHLFLPLHPLDVLWDRLSPPPDCLDLHWVLRWFLFPHL